MPEAKDNPIEVGKSGLKTYLRKRPTFWQLFALVALIIICLTAIIIVAIIYSRGLFLLAGGLSMLGKLVSIKKVIGVH